MIRKISLFFMIFLLASLCFGQAWKNTGLGGAGMMTAPGMSPVDKNFMILSCDMGGVYRTIDGGANWSIIDWHQINNNGGYPGCYPAFHPSDKNKVYLLGVNGTTGYWGILVSSDQGVTWNRLASDSTLDSKAIKRIYVDPVNSSIMYAGDASGAYISTNSGSTWTQCSGVTGAILGFYSFNVSGKTSIIGTSDGVYSRDNDSGAWAKHTVSGPSALKGFCGGASGSTVKLYVTGDNNTIYVSSNRGVNWGAVGGTGLPANPYTDIVSAENNYDTVYVKYDGGLGIYKTSDGGNNWANVAKINDGAWRGDPDTAAFNVNLGWCDYDLTGGIWFNGFSAYGLFACATDANCVVVNGGECYLTTDGGGTWNQVYTKYAGTGAKGKGKNWAPNGLEVTTVWNYYVHPQDKNKHYICYTDLGFARSEDAGSTWKSSFQDVPISWENTFYEVAFDYDDPAVMYGAASANHDIPTGWFNWLDTATGGGGIVKSTDYGANWTSASNGLPPESALTPPLGITMDPTDKTLYAMLYGGGLYKSTDKASTWTKVTTIPQIGSNNHYYRMKIHADGTFFVSITVRKTVANQFPDPGGLFMSKDKGLTWKNIAANADAGNGLYWPMLFDVHPTDSKIIYYAAFSAGSHQGGLFKTIDQGATWSRISVAGSNTFYGIAPVIDQKTPSTLYLGTFNTGAFVSKDSGNTWSELPIPFNNITNIALDYSSNSVFVMTYGNGVWMQDGSSVTPPVTGGDAWKPSGYPNPCRIDSSFGKQFKVSNLPGDAIIEIYDVNGTLIRRLDEKDFGNAGWVGWDGKNSAGEKMPQGMYLYSALTSLGRKVCRFAILR